MTIAEDLQQLGADVAAWSTSRGFRPSDDIPRTPRPPAWVPLFAPSDVAETRAQRAALEARLRALDVSGEDVAVQVDHRLLGAVLARGRWDLDVLRSWEHDPVFLLGQVLGPWFDLLLPPPPYPAEVQDALLAVARGIPARVDLALANLAGGAVADLAVVAAGDLADIERRFAASVDGLDGVVDPGVLAALRDAAPAAGAALAGLRTWLQERMGTFEPSRPVGREQFVWFLRHVALIAEEPEELVRAARQDHARAVVAETVTRHRHRDVPEAPLDADVDAQCARAAALEDRTRDFLEREDLLSQPPTLRRYLSRPLPASLEPLRFLGVNDDLTDEHRLDQDGVTYKPQPGPDLQYFDAAAARDPRLGIVHEGAHYKQLALTHAHPDPIRRRYVDSAANEGIAFYNEELMLLAGLFDDAPHSQTVVHNFNRLRCLRVVVDVSLATGDLTLADAVDLFVRTVPMDRTTAQEECAAYLNTPGLAMSYHVGKQQLLRLAADVIARDGDAFRFRDLHDRVWGNGNVPFSLQRWEILGDRSEVDALDRAVERDR
ncbi:DUF885 family protein [Isoptericola sp. NPDC057559]|uniref:DUF885 family protein n=1 Tax=Isoptericola sp. NPDC057559 TaxID=3346168 RepID=UPI0036B45DCC